MTTLEERFEDKVERKGCWEWTGAANEPGYGRIKVDGKMSYAHRVAYELYNGEIPNGKQVNHSCHNPSCVNPDHLYVGTQKQNVQDAIERGEWNQQEISGEEHGQSKLTEQEVVEIRSAYESNAMNQYELADEYDVARSTIQAIVNHETWKQVGGS